MGTSLAFSVIPTGSVGVLGDKRVVDDLAATGLVCLQHCLLPNPSLPPGAWVDLPVDFLSSAFSFLRQALRIEKERRLRRQTRKNNQLLI